MELPELRIYLSGSKGVTKAGTQMLWELTRDGLDRRYVSVTGDLPLSATQVPEELRLAASEYTVIIPVRGDVQTGFARFDRNGAIRADGGITLQSTGEAIVVNGTDLEGVLALSREALNLARMGKLFES
jgi:hypothetical protein